MITLLVSFYEGLLLGGIHFIVGILIGSLLKIFKPGTDVLHVVIKYFTFSAPISFFAVLLITFFHTCGSYPFPPCEIPELFFILLFSPLPIAVILIGGILGTLAGLLIYKIAHMISRNGK